MDSAFSARSRGGIFRELANIKTLPLVNKGIRGYHESRIAPASIANPWKGQPVPMSFSALAVILLLVILAAITGRRLGRLNRKLEEAESRLGGRIYRLQGRVAEMEATLGELEFERKRGRGELRIDLGTKLEEALEIHPRVREILGSYGISGGGCGGGALDESRSIHEACRAASVDSGAVLESLQRFLADPEDVATTPVSQAKLYQIGKNPARH
jgi:hypothetical protein